jgi:hypothetical protein
MFGRMLRAAQLDVIFYEKVEADPSYLREAFQVVLLVSVLSGLGVFIEYGDFWRLLGNIITNVVGWFVWSVVVLWIGTTLTKGPETEADLGQMLRVLGYACSPLALTFFSFIPYLGGLIVFVTLIWQLAAGIVAVRQALDFTTSRAILTVVLGWLVMIVVGLLLGLVLGLGVF